MSSSRASSRASHVGRHQGPTAASVSSARLRQAQADDAGIEAWAAVVNTHVELPRPRPSSTISVGAKSSVAAKSWPYWNEGGRWRR